MGKRGIQPSDLADASAHGFSQGVLIDDVLYVSGQVSRAPDLKGQVAEAWANVLRVVEEAGGTPNSIVKIGVFTMDEAAWTHLQPLVEASTTAPRPASTMVRVAGLADARFLVEIEAIAHLA